MFFVLCSLFFQLERFFMSLTHRRPLGTSLMLLLIGALLAGCQSIVVSQAPTTTPAARPSSPATRIPETAPEPSGAAAASSAAGTTGTAEASGSPADSTPEALAETPQPADTSGLATIESLYDNLLPRRDPVQLAFEYGRTTDMQRTARAEPFDVKVGDTETFSVANVNTNENFEINATLVLILEHVLVYVEEGLEIDMAALERSMRQFNDEIYPRNRELFGEEWSPGVDGDPRLTVLNARIEGAGGYFSGKDAMPKSVNRFSNEREMFYINVESQIPGSDVYGSTLAHEFQHMIEWNEAERPTIWMNEGLSQLSEELNGFTDSVTSVVPSYVLNPDLQLTTWGDSPSESIAHYGASYLFMTYFYEKYGKDLSLRQLIRDGAGERLELFADIARQQNPAINDFGDLYADWSVANLINDPRFGEGRYSYKQLASELKVQPEPLGDGQQESVAQFGSDFWQIEADGQERVLRFDGSDTIGVVAAEPEGSAMWWSNRGDNAHGTLTRSFDLRGVTSATLQLRLWYHLEADYDYGFVSVSTDGGKTFTSLSSRYTTTEDPQGANWGNGYTGTSSGASSDTAAWVDEQIDLTPYAGKEIVLRFSMITDDAVTKPGMVLDNIRIPEINFSDDAESDAAGWQATGFARTNNQLPQRWEVRLVRINGRDVTFEPLELDAQNRGEYRLAANERGALVVMGTTPHTTERASYEITVSQP